ncbi:Thioredoxin-like fold [Pseudocohnilembus persalinus]|uniref:Thioredoxin-like fold n=1 Tax=Pseudocohnilembus persalinus TaxID=266149 RepID=A0A0V0QK36_PSEPJ|nr:Thioredoxin-like fold [Pseudocohnilembus persalinus]|eukprot:KRX02545.1 Thioredoxin-like fold [Pseudocohnilembus persalinus]
MAQEKIEIDYNHFEDEYKGIISKEKNAFVVFMSNKDPQSHRPWSTDCENITGTVDQLKADANKEGVKLWICRVGNQEQWNDAGNPLKIHEVAKIKTIPTIILFQNGQVARKLEKSDIEDQDDAKKLMELIKQ